MVPADNTELIVGCTAAEYMMLPVDALSVAL
jgi:hypothetical protein